MKNTVITPFKRFSQLEGMSGFRNDVAVPLSASFLESGGKCHLLAILDEGEKLRPAEPHKAGR